MQAELALPAPAIAVSGTDGLQLWFSLAEPVSAARAHRFLDGLRQRFLPDVEHHRLRLMPRPDASANDPQAHAPLVPAQQGPDEHWSAFVAPDLAPVFAESPWLDIPPGADGQAALLAAIATTTCAAFEAAADLLEAQTALPPEAPAARAHVAAHAAPASPTAAAAAAEDARRFLQSVMRDDTAELALRIAAASALLRQG